MAFLVESRSRENEKKRLSIEKESSNFRKDKGHGGAFAIRLKLDVSPFMVHGFRTVFGREISKTRPVVIVSIDQNNVFSGAVTILPINSNNLERIYPVEVLLPKGTANLPKDSKGKADPIRTLDKSRLVEVISDLGLSHGSQIEQAMKFHLPVS